MKIVKTISPYILHLSFYSINFHKQYVLHFIPHLVSHVNFLLYLYLLPHFSKIFISSCLYSTGFPSLLQNCNLFHPKFTPRPLSTPILSLSLLHIDLVSVASLFFCHTFYVFLSSFLFLYDVFIQTLRSS